MLCIRYHFDDLREWDGQIGIEYKRANGSNSNSNRAANDNYTRYYFFSFFSSSSIKMWCGVEYSVLVLQRVVYSYSMNCNRRQRDNNNHNNNNNNSNKRALITSPYTLCIICYLLFGFFVYSSKYNLLG